MGVAISKSSKQSAAAAAPEKSKKSWFTKGDATATVAAQEDKRIEQKQAEQGKLWRFWLDKGGKAEITFVDGGLTDKGVLDCFMYREHHLFINGKWNNYFVCVGGDEPCPICETGDEPSLVSVFTIIDHREYKSKKGETFVNTPKLFVAKRGTHKLLQAEAVKRGGLQGVRFDVARLGESAPAVGDSFSFTSKEDPAKLRKMYTQKVKDKSGKEQVVSLFVPADYEDEVIYRPGKVLREMGFGKGTPIGGEGPAHGGGKASKEVEDAM